MGEMVFLPARARKKSITTVHTQTSNHVNAHQAADAHQKAMAMHRSRSSDAIAHQAALDAHARAMAKHQAAHEAAMKAAGLNMAAFPKTEL